MMEVLLKGPSGASLQPPAQPTVFSRGPSGVDVEVPQVPSVLTSLPVHEFNKTSIDPSARFLRRLSLDQKT